MTATSTFHDSHGHRPGTGSTAGRGEAGGTAPFRSGSDRNHLRLVPEPVPAVQAPLRLTRRGRFVVYGLPLVLLAALILSLGGVFNAPAKAAESASELALTPTVTVTVQPGESLWVIAGVVSPERDPRDVIAEIVQLNNLEAARVLPGQQLFVPTR